MMNAHDPLLGFSAPQVPDGLRERVLSAARRAAAEPVARPGWVDVLWDSRVLWRAWASAVAVLLAAYVWLDASAALSRDGASRGDCLATIARLRIGGGGIGSLGATRPYTHADVAWRAVDRVELQ